MFGKSFHIYSIRYSKHTHTHTVLDTVILRRPFRRPFRRLVHEHRVLHRHDSLLRPQRRADLQGEAEEAEVRDTVVELQCRGAARDARLDQRVPLVDA